MKLSRRHLLFPFLLVMYEISIYLSNDMYLPALPEMMRHLQLSATEAQLTITMWFIGSAIMPIVMGGLADRFGRRPTLLVGGVFYVLATFICAMSQTETSLLAARLIEGAMVSSMMVAGYASIHELYDHKDAIRMLALMGSISVLAPALGPLIGACILLVGSWRLIFWVIGIYSSLMLFNLYRYMPETLADEKRQSLHFGKLLLSYGRVLRNSNFLLLMLILGFTFGGFISWISAGPLLVIESFKFSALAFGGIQVMVFAVYIAGNHWVQYLLETRDAHGLVVMGLVITLIGGMAMFIFAIAFPSQFYLFLASMIVYSFGSALCFAPLNRLIIEASDEPMGVRVAMFTVALTGFGVLGSGLASIIFDGSLLSLSYLITTGVVVACLLQLYFHFKQGPKL